MGLDISVYKNIDFESFKSKEGMTEEELDNAYDEMLHMYAFESSYNQSDGIKAGFYNYPKREFSFRAGSYSGYNSFRKILCNSFYGFAPETIWTDAETYAGQSFVELINFSDCEGFIGYKTSQKLFEDFTKNRDRFINYLESEGFDSHSKEYYTQKYDEWMKAFEVASEQGIVLFH